MLRGLSKKLMAGVPRLNRDLSISVLSADGSEIERIPASALASGGIGYFFERIVGLRYEQAGYLVEYRNSLGYHDRGVDLVANKGEQRRFVQCKFTLKRLPVSRVEQLLFAASSFVRANLGPSNNHFDLAVPSKSIAFPEQGGRTGKAGGSPNRAKTSLERYNLSQSLVRLHVVEVPIEVPDGLIVGSIDQPRSETPR